MLYMVIRRAKYPFHRAMHEGMASESSSAVRHPRPAVPFTGDERAARDARHRPPARRVHRPRRHDGYDDPVRHGPGRCGGRAPHVPGLPRDPFGLRRPRRSRGARLELLVRLARIGRHGRHPAR
ncbi:hypothetical protein SSPO_030430 [Streptomyces antimycoticus]|uniref:Uncharacterized protein n=1 Tax=Streptomyces antimycoticus TaxID=68175 RepID=A0A499UFH0_9ACTN|nr:hypothetical protein SSPO_030430 [Streptomyces antimycoticus]